LEERCVDDEELADQGSTDCKVEEFVREERETGGGGKREEGMSCRTAG